MKCRLVQSEGHDQQAPAIENWLTVDELKGPSSSGMFSLMNRSIRENKQLLFYSTAKKFRSFTFPIPGVSLTLLAARRRQGGAGGGAFMRAEQKLVENRGGSQDGDDVTGTAAAAAFCFFFFDDRFNFCAALREERQHTHTHTGELKWHPNLPFIVHKYHLQAKGKGAFDLWMSSKAATKYSISSYYFASLFNVFFFNISAAGPSSLTHSFIGISWTLSLQEYTVCVINVINSIIIKTSRYSDSLS